MLVLLNISHFKDEWAVNIGFFHIGIIGISNFNASVMHTTGQSQGNDGEWSDRSLKLSIQEHGLFPCFSSYLM